MGNLLKLLLVVLLTLTGVGRMTAVEADSASVVLLLHENKLGHIALLVSGEDGKFSFYSINGNNIYLSARPYMGGWYVGNSKYDDLGLGNWDSPVDFLRSSYNADGSNADSTITSCRYTVAYQIPTTLEQNRVIEQCFRRMSSERYNLFKNNCATACLRSLWTAGLPTDPSPGTPVPPGMPRPNALSWYLNYLADVTGSFDYPYTTFRRLVLANPSGHFIHY